MSFRHASVVVAAAFALVAGSPVTVPSAGAAEPPPSLSGEWGGAVKGQESSFAAPGKPARVNRPCTASLAEGDGILSLALGIESEPAVGLAGRVGNGAFWAADPAGDVPLLLAGRVLAKGKKLSARMLAGADLRTTDATMKVSRSEVGALAPPLVVRRVAAKAAAAAAPPPALAGVWTGAAKGKRTSVMDAAKPVKVGFPVLLVADLDGPDASVALTLPGQDGEVVLPLAGRSANGVFWAFNGDGAAPVLVVGRTSGKEPRAKVRARAILAGPAGFAEVTFSLKRSAAAVRGTAAAGAPVAGATVTLKDRTGDAVTAVTGPGGAFTLSVAGLEPPFVMAAALPGGGRMYGVATEAGVANLHPLTDLIVRTWYQVQGLDAVAAFEDLDASTPAPTVLEVRLLETLVRRVVSKWLADEGLDPAAFDLIRSPFSANGTGLDAVLDATTVAPGGDSVTITDGTTTQQSAFAVSAVAGTVLVDTTVTSPAGTSENRDGTLLPGDTAMDDAVAGVLATAGAFFAKVTARKGALTANDLLPFLSPDFLDEGLGPTEWTAENATGLRGLTATVGGVRAVTAWDEGAGTIELSFRVHLSTEGFEEDVTLDMTWRKVDSAWLLHGDQRMSRVDVSFEFRTDRNSWGTVGPRRVIDVQVGPPIGLVQSVTIHGGGVFDHAPVPKGPEIRTVTYHPTPTSDLTLQFDMFFINLDVDAFPAPGTEFQVTVTPFAGPPRTYTLRTGGTTTEAVTILEPTGHDLALDAHPGTPLTVRWTRPTTFAVEDIEFSGTGRSQHYAHDVQADAPVATTATQGTVTLPATAGGEPVQFADVWLSFTGPAGERIVVVHNFD